jgi:hypothetical protein
MVYNLPMEDSPSTSTRKAFGDISNFYNDLVKHAAVRAQNRRAEEMQPYTIKHLMAQIQNANAANQRAQGLYGLKKQALENSLDPNYEINKKINMIKMLQERFGKKLEPQEEMNDESFNELYHRQLPDENENPLLTKLKSIGMFNKQEQGQGALLPEELEPEPGDMVMTEQQINKLIAQQKLKNTGKPKGFTDEEHALGEMIKAETGYNPYPKHVETPEEKDARALELYNKKLEAKKAKIGENVPLTGAMQTKLQGVVSGVDNALPVIEDLITDFKNLPTGSETFNPSAYAAYNAKANAIIEPLINAFGLNVTDATKEMMHDQVFRKTNEPLKKYKERLIDLAKEIIRRRDDSFKSLKSGSIDTKSKFTNEYFENLKNSEETKIINGKLYHKINGEWDDGQ